MSNFATRIIHGEDTLLQMTWLPTEDRTLLVGLRDRRGDDELGCMVDATVAGRIADALECQIYYTHPQVRNGMALDVGPANRGEPYREGIEITLTESLQSSLTVFLDNGHVGDLATLIRNGL